MQLQLGVRDYMASVTSPNVTGFNLDGSSDAIAAFYQADTTEAITHIGIYIINYVSPPTYKVSIQGVSSGEPDGTIKGGGSAASATFDPSSFSSGTFQWITLDNSYTPSQGEFLAFVIEYSSGTISSSNDCNFGMCMTGFAESIEKFPTTSSKTSTWASKSEKGYYAIIGYRTASSRFGLPFNNGPFSSTKSITTTGHREAAKFSIPSTLFENGVVCRGMTAGRDGASDNHLFGIWNAAGTELASATIDTAIANSGNDNIEKLVFDSDVTLDPDTTYYAGIEKTAADCGLAFATVASANDMLCFPFGTSVIKSTWNGSTWSDTTTQRPTVLNLSIESGVAGGGGGSGITSQSRIIQNIGTY